MQSSYGYVISCLGPVIDVRMVPTAYTLETFTQSALRCSNLPQKINKTACIHDMLLVFRTTWHHRNATTTLHTGLNDMYAYLRDVPANDSALLSVLSLQGCDYQHEHVSTYLWNDFTQLSDTDALTGFLT